MCDYLEFTEAQEIQTKKRRKTKREKKRREERERELEVLESYREVENSGSLEVLEKKRNRHTVEREFENQRRVREIVRRILIGKIKC